MFTPEGELREEYRDLMEKAKAEPAPAMAPEAARQPEPPPAWPPVAEAPHARGGRPPAPEPEPEMMPLDFPSTPPGLGPGFFDLAAMLAEPAALYLGDVPLPNGQTAEDLEMARMHIDLLDVLRQKTIGNLTAQESAFL